MFQTSSNVISKFARKKFSTAHVVAIRDPRTQAVIAQQLRFDGGGPGKSAYFAVGRYGSEAQAKQAAAVLARQVGVKLGRGRGGRHESADRGIRFEWVDRVQGATLFVCAAWTDRQATQKGVHRVLRHTAYSTAKHGLEGALDKAIDARTSQGAPRPDKGQLLTALQREYRRGPR